MANSVVGNNAFLKVDPADLNTKAGEIDGKIGMMEDCMNQMRSTFDNVSENWQSTSGDEYKGKAEILIDEIRESLENLRLYVEDLKNAAAKYEELESEIGGKVKALSDAESIFN